MAIYKVVMIRDEKFARDNLVQPFLWGYLIAQKKIFNILINGKDIRPYRKEVTGDKAVFVQEGDIVHLTKEKDKLDKFFYGDMDTLTKDESYKRFYNDGRLKIAINKLRKIKDYPGKSVMNFFLLMGIVLVWNLEKDLNTSVSKV